MVEKGLRKSLSIWLESFLKSRFGRRCASYMLDVRQMAWQILATVGIEREEPHVDFSVIDY